MRNKLAMHLSPRCLEALLAVQIAATGFASLKFLQLGQRHLEDAYIEVYGGYGTRLLRLQLALYGVDPRISALPQADYPSPPAMRAPMACCYIGCNTMKHPRGRTHRP
jgi:hypothetical protein